MIIFTTQFIYISCWLKIQPKCVCVCVCVYQLLSSVQLFVILWMIAHQATLSMEFSRQECQSGQPFSSPGDLPDPGIEPRSPALQADSSSSGQSGKPQPKCNTALYLCFQPSRSHLVLSLARGTKSLLFQDSQLGNPSFIDKTIAVPCCIRKYI